MRPEELRVHAQVDLDKMAHNLTVVRHMLNKDCQLMSVLKADAYGHGAAVCAPACERLVDWYGVATLEEALCLRRTGVKKPVLLFGRVPGERLSAACEAALTLCAFSLEYARFLSCAMIEGGRCVDVHIKVDTGLNRTGIPCRENDIEQALVECSALYALPGLRVTGMYTHFSCPDSPDENDIAFTKAQFRAFSALCAALRTQGRDTGLLHCCSSAAILLYPEMHLDMVRVGMLQFGQCMTEESLVRCDLRPILDWRAPIIVLRDVPPDESISYGRSYRATQAMRVAVVSLGYADGYRRCLSNRARVLLRGQFVPVVGKICMDFLLVDVSDLPKARVGDLVTVLGQDGDACISTNYLSELMQGVNGEVTCSIAARVPRVYLQNGALVAGYTPNG